MVMKNVMRKNLIKSIRKSLTRYIAIVAIIALGAAIFVGLRTTKSDMIATGQKYMDVQNMFDLQFLNTYGWSDAQLDQIRTLAGEDKAEGTICLDALARLEGADKDNVYKLYAVPQQVNRVQLQGGRMPQTPGECLIDGFHVDESLLGQTLTISAKNDEETLDSLTQHSFTIVGYVSSPIYMDMSRGTTTLGNGAVVGFVYMPKDSFQMDYYTDIAVSLPGNYTVYTQEFDEAMEAAEEALRPQLETLAQQRYEQVLDDARTQYADGLAEYNEGYAEYLEGKQEAEQELAKAEAELLDAEKTIQENTALLADGQSQLEEGEKTLAQKKQELADGEKELNSSEATVKKNLAKVEDGIAQIDEGLPQLEDGISQLESGLQQLNATISTLNALNSTAQSTIASLEKSLDWAESMGLPASAVQDIRSQLAQWESQRKEYEKQLDDLKDQKDGYSKQLADLKAQKAEIEAQRQELVEAKAQLEDAKAQIDAGRKAIVSGKQQIATGEKELAAKKIELENGRIELENAQKQVDEGWEEYNAGKAEVEQELADAQQELADGKQKLDDALETINTMEPPELYILNRNTNAGYLALDSNSDIVKGVSTVFPAFFLLIAALVCITTMTRMVEEERTEIGTLKALGYTSWEIIRKYLYYSGSAALLGCGLGVLMGSVVFPMILWEAYRIIFNITPNVILQVDWFLCGLVVFAYTAVNLLVTWYCCRRILANVPAELIRPKAPTSGKKIFLEYLPFWNRFSFLNKVMLRNIFRYTQRLLMMLIGIGGCTALLLTGFGLRDSIVDIVDFQFDQITLYDMDVRFSQGQTQEQMAAFRQDMQPYSQDVYFFHQSGAEIISESVTRDITMVVGDENITRYMDFHRKGKSLALPGQGEALLSVGIAEIMDISVGDKVSLRNADMQEMELTVTGIYENYVYNYVFISPQTYEQGWGKPPELQVACLNVSKGQDVHTAGTQVTQADGVMTVTICQDLAEQVGAMMDALDLVVATVVICAGALAVIVLYNLTNINITERIREIATIKVLGFRAGESAAYVFKENLLLSVMGAALGLIFGRFLLMFVISMIKVDMVWLQTYISAGSYILAIALTLLCACLVDFVLYFRLEKINMAEALKSVE